MRKNSDYRSMPLILGLASLGFLVACIGLATSTRESLELGHMLLGVATPLALAYLHFVVLTDVPWWMTWSGFVLGAVGCIALLSGQFGVAAEVAAAYGFAMIGASFVVSPSKPTPPGIFFLLGGAGVLLNAILPTGEIFAVIAYAALAFTFGFGAFASTREAIRMSSSAQ